MAEIKKIGILTGGGDCPGLNAVIRAVVYKAKEYGWDVLGVKYGWKGMLNADASPLEIKDVENILPMGGTILKTSRTNPFKVEGGPEKVLENAKKMGIDCLVAVGGEDTLGVANKLTKMGLNCVGVPKTIDNDLGATDYTFGYQTAVQIASDAIDRLHTTACSHDRVIVCEIMGRHAGWMTVDAGMAGSAHWIFTPEVKGSVEDCCNMLRERRGRGENYAIIAVAEGALFSDFDVEAASRETDAFGHVKLGGVAEALAKEIEKRTRYETRHVVLGHTQRGGTPMAYDRVLGTRLGYKAAEMVKSGQFAMMASLRGENIEAVPIEEAVKELKTVPEKYYNVTKTFFG
ncbi:6-phosphofructokinase [Methanocella sp. CWC-04]|uniref:Pyrophosphate--fructose 6-phosphate 1-phosphotransferase n=1 Tax=Methanooceanicella nereidis TaxID=2052831 RepID=A0AAP2RD18_9EURY|nr:ATP-dependent 6-phosphofructokinase [Methanocella sp. CWC-04]MCD1294651.1 6-phosphofructokinase [Methanocella sp. CWC-04]